MADIAEQLRAMVREEVAAALAAERAAAAPAPGLVTLDAYARARSISVSTVRAAIRDGRLVAHHIGRAVRVRRDDEIARVARPKSDRTAVAARKLGLSVVR